jgi:hypothetical protein
MFEQELSDAVRDIAKAFARRKANHALIGGWP